MPNVSRSTETALVIGSGIGGLSSAIILARLGFDVTVVEKNPHPGGMLRSFVRQGVHCNVGLHYLGAMDQGQILRRCFDFLGITDHLPLLRMGGNTPVDRYYFTAPANGPDQFDMPIGLDAYEAHLIDAFPAEHEAITAFMARLRGNAEDLHRLGFLYEPRPMANLIEQTEPLWDFLDRAGCSPGLKSVISVPSVWIGVPADQCPFFYHTMVLASYLFSSWRLQSSGTHMAKVLHERLIALGGKLVTGHAVRRIDIRKGHLQGVTLDNGESIGATKVIAAVHPKIVLDLLGPENFKPSYRRRIMGLKDTAGMLSVNALVPRNGHQPIPHNIFLVRTTPNGNVDDVIYLQLRPCERPGYLLLSLLTAGSDALWQPWRQTRSGQRGEDYMRLKKTMARRIIHKVEPITGVFSDLELIDVYTPLSIRDWVNSPNGSAYGVMRSCNQLLSAAVLNRTSVPGLYLAGQSVMAPGILGTILGSLATVKFIVGPERFKQEVRL
ncbi:MAG: NAD(P)/FAD-dependent oxidoreductase [Desulfosarcina sp.]|nr:NAD(P)/FAD-dependent oxidoreductase [Desulfobacterales bacterium]